MKSRFLSAPLALLAMLGLSACDPISLGLGAGAATGVAAYQERGIRGVASDSAVEARIFKLWFERDKKMVVNMSIEVYEGRALLTGFAGSEEIRAEAVGLAWRADGVEDVINEILVGPPSGLAEVARDTAITTELKAKLTFDDKVQAVNFTIETIRGTIFLLGIAQNQAELDRVIARANDISYVRRVVSYVRVMAVTKEGEP